VKEVFRNADHAQVSILGAILENEGILCFTQNSATQQSLIKGMLPAFFPLPDFWPALCVVNDDDYPEAMKVLTELRKSDPSPAPEWKCASCGETVPDNFASCWKCQTARERE
jgi:hypothetical protein